MANPGAKPVVDLSAPDAPGREHLYAQLGGLSDEECTYFLCPDADCTLFTKPNCPVPCDRVCPKQAEKVIVCFSCKRPIILSTKHFSFCRVECGCGAQLFSRMSGRYRRHNLIAPPAAD